MRRREIDLENQTSDYALAISAHSRIARFETDYLN